MFIDQIYISAVLAIILLLSLVLIIVVYIQTVIFRKYAQIKQNNEQLRSSLAAQEGEILREARQKAETMIEEAIQHTAKTEKDAQINQIKITELLEKAIFEIVQNTNEKCQNASQSIKENYLKSLREQIDNNLKELQKVSADFKQQALEEMKETLKNQKEEKLSQLNEKIYEILSMATEEILNKSLSLNDHEELILNALERAKKEAGL